MRQRAASGPRNGVGHVPSTSASSRHRHLVGVPEATSRAQPSPTRAHSVASWLGAALPLAVGLGALRASSGDLILIGGSDLALRVGYGGVLVVGAVGVQFALRWLVGFVDGRSDATRALVVVALAVLHVPGLMFHDPDLSLQWAPFVGSIGLVCLFVSGLALLPVAARTASVWLVRSGRLSSMLVPSMLRVLGFRSPPLFGLVLLWLLLAWSVPYEGYHEVRSLTGPFAGDSDIKLAGPRTPAEVAADWVARQNGTGRQPALLVAASGGGIRAAYWTSLVLTCAIERDGPETDPCRDPSPYAQARRESLLAMSGISGGSLGLASYVTAVGGQWSSAADGADATPLTMSWIDRRLGADFLSPTLATWLFNDGVNALLRPAQGVDRAAVLERAWEQEWPDTELEAPVLPRPGNRRPAAPAPQRVQRRGRLPRQRVDLVEHARLVRHPGRVWRGARPQSTALVDR